MPREWNRPARGKSRYKDEHSVPTRIPFKSVTASGGSDGTGPNIMADFLSNHHSREQAIAHWWPVVMNGPE